MKKRNLLVLLIILFMIQIVVGNYITATSDYISSWQGDNSLMDENRTSNNNLTSVSAYYTSGKYGDAFVFNGINQSLNATNSISSKASGTAMAWIRPNGNYSAQQTIMGGMNAVGDDHSARYMIFATDVVYICADYSWGIEIGNGVSYQYVCSDQVFNAANFSTNTTWTHLAFTYNGSNINLYQNGTLVKSVAQTVTAVGSAQPFAIGRNGGYSGQASDYHFNGSIDDVRIYERALNVSEINWAMSREYIPPVPVSVTDSGGNFWINHTWQAGSGNFTDSYNVSVNGVWVNGSANTYNNSTLSAHAWSNISVFAYNSTSYGFLNQTQMNATTQVQNNAVTISNVSDTYTTTNGALFQIYPIATDIDNDTITWINNTDGKGTFNTTNVSMINFTWVAEIGVWNWNITASDGYGSTTTKQFSVSVDSQTPGAPIDISATKGNFWTNTTWIQSTSTDSFNVSVNGTWANGTTANFTNVTLNPHGWSNVTVAGYNTTGSILGNSSSLNTMLSNNLPVISGQSVSSSSITLGSSTTFTVSISDADSDSLTNTVGITATSIGGSQINYSLVAGSGTNYSYVFTPATTGTYTFTNIYAWDTSENASSVGVLTVVVNAASTGSVVSGGGGGSGVVYITPVPTSTKLNISIANLTTGRNISDIDYISKCLSSEFFLTDECSRGGIVEIQKSSNWYTLIGAWFGSIIAIYFLAIIMNRHGNNFLLDPVMYSIVTIIFVLFMNLVGFNFIFIGNVLLNSQLSSATFIGMVFTGFFSTTVLDGFVAKKDKVYLTSKRIRL